MKLQTKFNVGDTVITPISEIPGKVECLFITKEWRGCKQSEPFLMYEVEMYFHHRCSRDEHRDCLYFRESDLRAA